MSELTKVYRLAFLYKLLIDENKISASYDFRTRTLLWKEITSIRPNPKGGGLLITNSGEEVVTFINPNLHEYTEIIKTIQEKCIEVWDSQEISTFHCNPISIFLLGLSGFATLLYPISFINNTGGDLIFKDWLFISLEIITGVFLIWYAINTKQKIFFQENNIIFKYILWKRKIHVSEIDMIFDEKLIILNIPKKPFYVRVQSPYILLKNGKKIDFGNVIEGIPILLNSIEKWKKKYLNKN